MWLRKMLKICLVFWKAEPKDAYKRYAYKKTCMFGNFTNSHNLLFSLS